MNAQERELKRLEALWGRSRRGPIRDAAPLLERQIKDMRRTDRVLEALLTYWAEQVPELAAAIRQMRNVHKVVIVTMPDASLAYQFDRWLRSPAGADSIRKAPDTVRRIRVQISK